jgi:hypothetical protein
MDEHKGLHHRAPEIDGGLTIRVAYRIFGQPKLGYSFGSTWGHVSWELFRNVMFGPLFRRYAKLKATHSP